MVGLDKGADGSEEGGTLTADRGTTTRGGGGE